MPDGDVDFIDVSAEETIEVRPRSQTLDRDAASDTLLKNITHSSSPPWTAQDEYVDDILNAPPRRTSRGRHDLRWSTPLAGLDLASNRNKRSGHGFRRSEDLMPSPTKAIEAFIHQGGLERESTRVKRRRIEREKEFLESLPITGTRKRRLENESPNDDGIFGASGGGGPAKGSGVGGRESSERLGDNGIPVFPDDGRESPLFVALRPETPRTGRSTSFGKPQRGLSQVSDDDMSDFDTATIQGFRKIGGSGKRQGGPSQISQESSAASGSIVKRKFKPLKFSSLGRSRLSSNDSPSTPSQPSVSSSLRSTSRKRPASEDYFSEPRRTRSSSSTLSQPAASSSLRPPSRKRPAPPSFNLNHNTTRDQPHRNTQGPDLSILFEVPETAADVFNYFEAIKSSLIDPMTQLQHQLNDVRAELAAEKAKSKTERCENQERSNNFADAMRKSVSELHQRILELEQEKEAATGGFTPVAGGAFGGPAYTRPNKEPGMFTGLMSSAPSAPSQPRWPPSF